MRPVGRVPGYGWRGILLLALALQTPLLAQGQPRSPEPGTSLTTGPAGRSVLRVFYDDPYRIRDLVDYDLWEYRDSEERYVLVLVDAAERAEIEALGFRTATDAERTAELVPPQAALRGQTSGIPGFPCYRTVEETYDTAQQLVADYPALATWIDIGDSWEKTQGLGGYDLRVLRLTSAAAPGPKPAMFVTTALHPREYATAELATRLAEWLVEEYDRDPEATWILDHNEVHLMLQANPDGRKQAEAGELWRKNTNQAYCGATSLLRGADLNRNFDFEWACCGGSSGSECHESYHGPAAASEPETQAIQAYLRSLFPDLRDDSLTDPAPLGAQGMYIDMHAFGELVLWPWGFADPPNATELRTLGRRLAWFNGYRPEQANESFFTNGTADEFAYGDLGVPTIAYEIGNTFFESCTSFEGNVLPGNLASLVFAARTLRAPYRMPAGPESVSVLASPGLVDPGLAVTVTATLDDTRFNNSNGVEPTQNIQEAELYVDLPPWNPAAIAIPLAATDGSFDSPVEPVTVVLDTTGLAPGRHTIYMRGRDTSGRWGPIAAAWLFVADGSEGTADGVVTDAQTAAPLSAGVSVTQLGLVSATDPQTGAYSLRLPPGTWSLVATSAGYLPEQLDVTTVSGGSVPVDFALAALPPILLVDDDDNAPDVRPEYEAALGALGETYHVWDTANSDNEPDAATLAAFEKVIWFTGGALGSHTGPGVSGEAALGAWLDSSRCLWVSSQDYFFNRGITSFMQTYLGLASATNDVTQTNVTGQGAVFGGLGPYSLSYPYINYSDSVVPGTDAEVAFDGNAGAAALDKDNALYRTAFLGFGLEAIPATTGRQDTLAAFLGWCDALPQQDGDGDGRINGVDCAPADVATWSVPGDVPDLIVTRDPVGEISWTAPLDPGATAPTYDLIRSEDASDFGAALCLASNQSGTVAADPQTPPPATVYYYLVRTRNECGETLGADHAAVARSGAFCP